MQNSIPTATGQQCSWRGPRASAAMPGRTMGMLPALLPLCCRGAAGASGVSLADTSAAVVARNPSPKPASTSAASGVLAGGSAQGAGRGAFSAGVGCTASPGGGVAGSWTCIGV